MRGKVVVWAYLIILSFGTMLSLYMPKTEAAAKESIVIPGEAIRLRILANSDLDSDQALKRKVRDAVNAQITLWVQDLTSMKKARTLIKEKLPEIEGIAEKVVHEQGSNQTVKVQFGKVQFPTKLYGQFLYPAGEYQAVLITLGKGEGANWWCVLYPPLCFLDFSNGVAVSPGFNDKVQAATKDSKTANLKNETEPSSKNQVKAAEQLQTDGSASAQQAQSSKGDQAASGQTGEQKTEDQTASGQTGEQKIEDQTASNQAGQQEMTDQTDNKVNNETDTSYVTNNDEPNGQTASAATENQQTTDQKTEAVTDGQPKPQKSTGKEKKAPVYTAEDEQPVKVKFFVVELWEKLFD